MKKQSGFTTVEVLVTLIIAMLLVGGAYQAYNVVLDSSRTANSRSVANNLAYNAMRKQATSVTNATCTTATFNHTSTIPANTPLAKPWSLQTRRTCPFSDSSRVFLMTTTFTYGGEEVKHAIYVTN